MRPLLFAFLAAGLLLGASGVPSSGSATPSASKQPDADPVVVAAGDIACDPADPSFNGGNGTSTSCRQMATAALLAGATAVLPLGDTQYHCGSSQAFLQSYDPSWGQFKAISRPVVGNHEYETTADPGLPATGCDASNAGAVGYFDYFGTAAGERGKGYYSYDLGSWHLVALNSEVGGSAFRQAQAQWLHDDLAATTKPCILAYWHAPRFSSGHHGNDLNDSDLLWRELYAYRADVILNGHDHDYERFDLQDPDAVPTPQGIREFVVGTGGKGLTSFGLTQAANSQVRENRTFGVLELTLRPLSYDWRFVPEQGKTFTDSGTTSCHTDVPTSVRPSRCRAGFWTSGRNGRLRYTCLRPWRS